MAQALHSTAFDIGSFRKLGVLIIRILLFRVLYSGPYFRKLPYGAYSQPHTRPKTPNAKPHEIVRIVNKVTVTGYAHV